MMDAVRTSEIVVNYYHPTGNNNSEDSHQNWSEVVTEQKYCNMLALEK